MNPVSFEESMRRWSSTCMVCGEPCEAEEKPLQLALGHAMHRECYELWLETQDEKSPITAVLRAVAPVVQLLPGEEGMTHEQIAQRRHDLLYGKNSPSTRIDRKRPAT